MSQLVQFKVNPADLILVRSAASRAGTSPGLFAKQAALNAARGVVAAANLDAKVASEISDLRVEMSANTESIARVSDAILSGRGTSARALVNALAVTSELLFAADALDPATGQLRIEPSLLVGLLAWLPAAKPEHKATWTRQGADILSKLDGGAK